MNSAEKEMCMPEEKRGLGFSVMLRYYTYIYNNAASLTRLKLIILRLQWKEEDAQLNPRLSQANARHTTSKKSPAL